MFLRGTRGPVPVFFQALIRRPCKDPAQRATNQGPNREQYPDFHVFLFFERICNDELAWQTRRPLPSSPRRLGLEALEDRSVPAAFSLNGILGQLAVHGPSPANAAYVYTETNNPQAGLNAVLAFRRNGSTGALTQVGSYLTGGTGAIKRAQSHRPG